MSDNKSPCKVSPKEERRRDGVPEQIFVIGAICCIAVGIIASLFAIGTFAAGETEKIMDETRFTDEEALRFHSEGRPGKMEIAPTKPLTSQGAQAVTWVTSVALGEPKNSLLFPPLILTV